jgi:hypothetical protein
MLDLTRIDDAQAVDIPTDRVADFLDPPVVIVTQTDNAPFELGSGSGHGLEEKITGVLVHQEAALTTKSTPQRGIDRRSFRKRLDHELRCQKAMAF